MGTAYWKQNPLGNSYNFANDWVGKVFPGPTDTAIFAHSSVTKISVGLGTDTAGWTFAKGAGHYSFDLGHAVVFETDGLVIKAGSVSLKDEAPLVFAGASSAATAHITIVYDPSLNGGNLTFVDDSTAAHAHITNDNITEFLGSSTADHATIINNDLLDWSANSQAGNVVIINNSDAEFYDNALGGNAVITTNKGATTGFEDNSDPQNARLITKSGGTVVLGTTGAGDDDFITAGSIEGAGTFYLGGNELSLTSNRSTKVSGVITEGIPDDDKGVATIDKGGTGTLTRSNANNHFLGTLIVEGTLDVAAQGAAGDSYIRFDNSAKETLKIEKAALDGHAFDTAVVYLQAGDTIDFSSLKFQKGAHASIDEDTGLLSVTSGQVTDTVQLHNEDVASLKVVKDAEGGTKVIGSDTAMLGRSSHSAVESAAHIDYVRHDDHHGCADHLSLHDF